jgi:hypothetical protein
MTIAPILRHYNPLYNSILETDASNGIVASILSQLHLGREWYLVAYCSGAASGASTFFECSPWREVSIRVIDGSQ